MGRTADVWKNLPFHNIVFTMTLIRFLPPRWRARSRSTSAHSIQTTTPVYSTIPTHFSSSSACAAVLRSQPLVPSPPWRRAGFLALPTTAFAFLLSAAFTTYRRTHRTRARARTDSLLLFITAGSRRWLNILPTYYIRLCCNAFCAYCCCNIWNIYTVRSRWPFLPRFVRYSRWFVLTF